MFNSNFNPVHPLPLTLVMRSYIIEGTVLTRMGRLTDMMNDPDMASFVVTNAKVKECGSRRVVAEGSVQIQSPEVLFVHASDSTEGAPTLRTSKQPIAARLAVHPYTVDGTVHLGYEPELRAALADLADRWIPVTQARYWSYAVGEEPVTVDLLVVNRAHALIAVDSDVSWQPTAPDLGGSGGGGAGW